MNQYLITIEGTNPDGVTWKQTFRIDETKQGLIDWVNDFKQTIQGEFTFYVERKVDGEWSTVTGDW